MPFRPSHPSPSRVRRLLPASLLTVIVVLALAACSSGGEPTPRASGTDDRGCITDFDPQRDYFPDKSELRHAENFTISYERSYQVLTVNEPFPGGAPESYVLVRCGAPDPELPGNLAGATQVEVPVDSLYAASTTHLPLLEDLGVVDVLTGVATASYVASEQVRERIDAGAVTEFAPNEQLATELVIAEQPDVLMTGGFDDPAYAPLRNAGVPVLANAEWLEPTPLGRAEWVKYVAALTGTEAGAAEVFDQIEGDYQELADLAADAEPAEVLLGSLVQGTWSMPSGGGYFGQLVKDAGGTYPWAGEQDPASLQLDFETVYARGGQAPVWLANDLWATLDDAKRADPRHGELAAFQDGEVWTLGAAAPEGGADFFERGVTRPDLVLADLVAILHPDLAPDHEFAFYTRVE